MKERLDELDFNKLKFSAMQKRYCQESENASHRWRENICKRYGLMKDSTQYIELKTPTIK